MRRMLGVVLVALVLAGCGGGGGSDSKGPAEKAGYGAGFDSCPPLLGSDTKLTQRQVTECEDLGAQIYDQCEGGEEVAVVTVDDQPWGLAPGSKAEKLDPDFDISDLCP